jgi:hypothetical protein
MYHQVHLVRFPRPWTIVLFERAQSGFSIFKDPLLFPPFVRATAIAVGAHRTD